MVRCKKKFEEDFIYNLKSKQSCNTKFSIVLYYFVFTAQLSK